MMEARGLAFALTIISVVTAGGSPEATANDSPRFSIAQAQSELQTKLHTLIDKLRGMDMPAGVVKTNGRIEATQVDIAAKYPGRLESVMVEEGDEVGAGQTIAVISSPEYEAQLRGAQAQVLKAKTGRRSRSTT
jgi:HlyD family secretion protein